MPTLSKSKSTLLLASLGGILARDFILYDPHSLPKYREALFDHQTKGTIDPQAAALVEMEIHLDAPCGAGNLGFRTANGGLVQFYGNIAEKPALTNQIITIIV
jgi:hypothetical protein